MFVSQICSSLYSLFHLLKLFPRYLCSPPLIEPLLRLDTSARAKSVEEEEQEGGTCENDGEEGEEPPFSYHGGEDVLIKSGCHPQLRCLSDTEKRRNKMKRRQVEAWE